MKPSKANLLIKSFKEKENTNSNLVSTDFNKMKQKKIIQDKRQRSETNNFTHFSNQNLNIESMDASVCIKCIKLKENLQDTYINLITMFDRDFIERLQEHIFIEKHVEKLKQQEGQTLLNYIKIMITHAIDHLKSQDQSKVYEKQLQKLESDVRQHIGIEQQLKVYIEKQQQKIEELDGKENICDVNKFKELKQQLDTFKNKIQSQQQEINKQSTENQKLETRYLQLQEVNQNLNKKLKEIQELRDMSTNHTSINGINSVNFNNNTKEIKKDLMEKSFEYLKAKNNFMPSQSVNENFKPKLSERNKSKKTERDQNVHSMTQRQIFDYQKQQILKDNQVNKKQNTFSQSINLNKYNLNYQYTQNSTNNLIKNKPTNVASNKMIKNRSSTNQGVNYTNYSNKLKQQQTNTTYHNISNASNIRSQSLENEINEKRQMYSKPNSMLQDQMMNKIRVSTSNYPNKNLSQQFNLV